MLRRLAGLRSDQNYRSYDQQYAIIYPMNDLKELERQGTKRLYEIQREIAALKNPHMHWDLAGMDDLSCQLAIFDLMQEFFLLTEAKREA